MKQLFMALVLTLTAASGFARSPEMNCGPLQVVDIAGNGRLTLYVQGRLASYIQSRLQQVGANNGIDHLVRFSTTPYPVLEVSGVRRVENAGANSSRLQYTTGGPIGVSVALGSNSSSPEKLLSIQTGRLTSSHTIEFDAPIFSPALTINCQQPWN